MNKLNKGRVLGVAAVTLAAVSLIGVGFASWIVEGIVPSDVNKNVTVSVGDVTDKRVLLEGLSGDDVISFDCDGTVGNPIQSSKNEQGVAQNLDDRVFSVKYKLTPKDTSLSSLPVSVKVSVTLSGEFIEWMYKNTGYVTLGLDTNTDADFDLGAYDSSTKTVVATMTSGTNTKMNDFSEIVFKFGWGTKFGGKNPAQLKENEFSQSFTVDQVVQDLGILKTNANTKKINAVISAA